ncbi:MAG: ABC transporter ATP-binding protein, partial [Propionibacteriaceae bacterium]|nr:ABC transporter ATP-binding protein [Propionibacteriaceae bacterium]
MTAISVRDLVKSYGPVQAVRGISFDVEDGMFFAFLGVNGAGKSTTINCLTTLLKPNGGQAEVAGFRLGEQDDEIRRSIGVVFQPALLDPLLTVRENLALRALFHGMGKEEFAERVEQLTDLLGLGEFIDRRYGRLSGGQRRRSDIARGMLHTPQILFLDEPTAGLDPHSREQVWEAIMDVRELQGMTVFLTTHYMAETERADRVCIINAGEIVAEGTPEQLRARYSSSELKLHLSDEAWSRSELRQIGVDLPRSDGPGEPVTIQVASSAEAQDILATVWNAVDDFEFRHGSMDDVFLNLTSTNDDGATAQPRERADALDRTGEERRDDERAWGREASEPAWEREPLDDPRSWNQGEDHRRPQERWDASGAEDR